MRTARRSCSADPMWDEANEIADERGLTRVHPFDDLDLIAGQGTVGLELVEGFPGVDVDAPKGSKVACVLSGGNVNLEQLRTLDWN